MSAWWAFTLGFVAVPLALAMPEAGEPDSDGGYLSGWLAFFSPSIALWFAAAIFLGWLFRKAWDSGRATSADAPSGWHASTQNLARA